MAEQYVLYGYVDHSRKNRFSFVLPVFKKGDQFFRSIISNEDSRIDRFEALDTPLEIKEYGSETQKPFFVRSEAYYSCLYDKTLIKGNKGEVSLQMLKLIRKYKLNPIELYDIYYFLGDLEKLNVTIQEYVSTNVVQGLSPNNFYTPPILEINLEQFVSHVQESAKLLEYHSKFLSFETFFRPKEVLGAVRFLTYSLPRAELKDKFNNLINKYRSPFYKDLIVHCYMQNGMVAAEIKRDPAYKLRKLIQLHALDDKVIAENQELYKNSQSIFDIDSNALELAASVDKDIQLELTPDNENKDKTASGKTEDERELNSLKDLIKKIKENYE